MHEVSIDPQRCIGCGLCEEMLPEVFETGRVTAVVITPFVEGSLMEETVDAMNDCPVDAISVHLLLHSAPDHDDEECDREEEHRNIRQYQWKHRNAHDGDLVQTHHTERFHR